MKKTVVVLMALFMGLTVMAQKKEGQMRKMHDTFKDMSPEQVATLKSKKMALHLDLSESQTQQIKALEKERITEMRAQHEARKAQKEKGEAQDADTRFKMMEARLDQQLAHQKQMKQILNAEQYEQWKKMRHKKEAMVKRSQKKKKMHKRMKNGERK
ncbi:hypothetical protein [Sediminicola luteus]|uniref:DUF4890 domain-containing protein n=1 Tax=Sediminicola luteus TaxID=319238 RepID=A0A2A4GBB8_9FLAO|nr:hypothetical protein [Sediminicola luteus]PCE65743.1 hypothetical protein B7P33_00100 [Sediminicola luteus]